MARCPFAEWHPLSGAAGAFTSGPFKIVHHTTEGSTMAGALSALGAAHADSHFVVDDKKIVQLIDTSLASRSLRNKGGGVETNKDSAIQIEMVGFAGKAKNPATLANVRKLCRWIEATHGVPRVWPNGYPNPPKNGRDPGGHNRNAATWDTKGGHYGHSQVPENSHWDPAYTKAEVDFLMDAGPVAADDPAPAGGQKVKVVGVAPETLNLRDRATVSGRDLGDIPEGYVLTKTGEDGAWTAVETPFGAKGWVATRFLTAA